MAQPSSRQGLIDYGLRQLGAPVLEINIDDDQIDDLLDDAIQVFNERHFDGVEEMFLKYEFTQADIDRGKTHPGATGISTSSLVGTAGTSPFGNSGNNPEGIRVGGKGGGGNAVKVWEQRQYKNLDDSVLIGTRNIKMALRRLRKFARQSNNMELDMSGTIKNTAKNGGILDINMLPERTNAVKVLIFFDVGGSMDPYVKVCEELFSAVKTELKNLEYFYFHNCIYETVWKDNKRRSQERFKLHDVINKYSSDYKVILVGDATMAPYEITNPGGSIEHWNEEPGIDWLKRISNHFEKIAWLNPVPDDHWEYTSSVCLIKEIFEDRMYPLTLRGLENAMGDLSK